MTPSPRTAPVAPDAPTDGAAESPAPGTLDQIASRYALRRPEEVIEYLSRYPHLLPLVLKAADLFPRYFGEDAPLVLEVSSYPDGAPDDRDLFAIVQTSLTTDDATDRYFRLLDEWALAARPPGPGVLVLDFESS